MFLFFQGQFKSLSEITSKVVLDFSGSHHLYHPWIPLSLHRLFWNSFDSLSVVYLIYPTKFEVIQWAGPFPTDQGSWFAQSICWVLVRRLTVNWTFVLKNDIFSNAGKSGHRRYFLLRVTGFRKHGSSSFQNSSLGDEGRYQLRKTLATVPSSKPF